MRYRSFLSLFLKKFLVIYIWNPSVYWHSICIGEINRNSYRKCLSQIKNGYDGGESRTIKRPTTVLIDRSPIPPFPLRLLRQEDR
jgi:hypothetical protein